MDSAVKKSNSGWANWPVDREIVLTRLIDAPRALVYAAWADPEQIVAWFGPEGMHIETHEMDLREGGLWRFDMVTEAGFRYGNRMRFLRLEEPSLIEVEHGADMDDDPDRFFTLITFDEQSNGKTVLTLRQLHPSAQARDGKMAFGAVEYGIQTLNKLAAHVAAHTGR